MKRHELDMLHRSFGWKPDLPDPRDHGYRVSKPRSLPGAVDLRRRMPPVYDQGALGSCVAHAVGASMAMHLRGRRGFKTWRPARLFVYYNARAMEGTTSIDAGAQIRNGVKCAAKLGCPPERLWPYDAADPGVFSKRPPKVAYEQALPRVVSSYERVPRNLYAMQQCLAEGLPFVFGFMVFAQAMSPEAASNGLILPPEAPERPLGGHAALAVGYSDAAGRFLVRNSWGARWGQRGYFTMPYRYLLDENLSDDFWVIRAVS